MITPSDDPQTGRESQYRTAEAERKQRNRHRLFWGTWGCVVLAVAIILMAAMFPQIRQQSFLSKLKAGGARLNTSYDNSWGLHDASLWLQSTINIGLPIPEQVHGIDLQQYPTDDKTLQAITGWPHLEFIAINQSRISANALERFVTHTPQLSRMQIINCPDITPDQIRNFRMIKPSLQIEFRGTAFLGIRGHDTPEGCMVFYIQPRSGAHQAGLQYGDIIKSIDGQPTPTFQQLVELIGEHEPGDLVELDIQRKGQALELISELGGWEDL